MPIIPWTPVGEYVDRIAQRNQLRKWGLSTQQLDQFASSLVDHDGLLFPTGINVTLGRGFAYNWQEAMSWLADSVKAHGNYALTEDIDATRLSYRFGSEPASNERRLMSVFLDFQTYWDQERGIEPREVLSGRKQWPGLEIAWLFALSPQAFAQVDSETIPWVVAAGLVVDFAHPVMFTKLDEELMVTFGEYGDLMFGSSVAAFGR